MIGGRETMDIGGMELMATLETTTGAIHSEMWIIEAGEMDIPRTMFMRVRTVPISGRMVCGTIYRATSHIFTLYVITTPGSPVVTILAMKMRTGMTTPRIGYTTIRQYARSGVRTDAGSTSTAASFARAMMDANVPMSVLSKSTVIATLTRARNGSAWHNRWGESAAGGGRGMNLWQTALLVSVMVITCLLCIITWHCVCRRRENGSRPGIRDVIRAFRQVVPEGEIPSAPELPHGWKEARDPASGSMYYYNSDGRVQWSAPESGKCRQEEGIPDYLEQSDDLNV